MPSIFEVPSIWGIYGVFIRKELIKQRRPRNIVIISVKQYVFNLWCTISPESLPNQEYLLAICSLFPPSFHCCYVLFYGVPKALTAKHINSRHNKQLSLWPTTLMIQQPIVMTKHGISRHNTKFHNIIHANTRHKNPKAIDGP